MNVTCHCALTHIFDCFYKMVITNFLVSAMKENTGNLDLGLLYIPNKQVRPSLHNTKYFTTTTTIVRLSANCTGYTNPQIADLCFIK